MVEAVHGGLVDAIYAAALGEVPLERFTDAIAAAFDAPQTLLLDVSAAPETVVRTGFTTEFDAPYRDYFSAVDPWIAAGRSLPVGTAMNVERLVPRRDYLNSEFYVDYMRMHGAAHQCMGVMFDAADRHYSLTMFRAHGQRDIAIEEEERYRALLPHLRRSLATRVRLARVADDLDRLGRAAAAGSAVSLLVDAQLGVAWASGEPAGDPALGGARIGARNGAMAGGGARLSFADPVAHAAMRRAVHAATAARHRTSGAVPVAAGYVLVDPLPPGAAAGEAPLCLVRLPEADGGRGRALTRAAGLFALTPAETALCATLFGGGTVDGHAEAAAISPWTARTHLKNVFAKTGVQRQPALVALLHRLAG